MAEVAVKATASRAGTPEPAVAGGSRVVDPEGRVVAQAPRDEPALTLVDVDVPAARRHRRALPLLAEGRLHLIEREVRRLIEQGGDA